MATWAVLTVTALYAFTSIIKIIDANYWWAVIWGSYALANYALLKAMG